MKYAFFLHTLFCLVGCGKPEIASTFIPYFDVFEKRYHVTPYDVGAQFGDPSKGRGAECILSLGPNRIVVDKKVWDTIGGGAKEEMMFHELGHCVLNLPHLEGKVLYKGEMIPGSIMQEENFVDAEFYAELREKYLDALPKNIMISL